MSGNENSPATPYMAEAKAELIPTRASLLHRLKDWQNQATWQEFFDIYWKLIYGVARKAGLDDGEAQDAVQEVLLHVARQMPAFRYDPAIGSFKGWLLTKTRWCVIAQLRQRARGRQSIATSSTPPDALEEIPDPSAAPLEEAWERDWQQTLFDAALGRVRKRANGLSLQLFDFYVRKEMPAEEVAVRFETSIDQVYLAKHRITAELKKEIARLEREVT